MRKRILFIFVFILIIFVGENSKVYADVPLQCKIGDDDCTIENVNEEINKIPNSTPLCIYEVEFGNNKYYNYIYNSELVGNFSGNLSYGSGTTFSSINTILWPTVSRKTNLFSFSDPNAGQEAVHYITDNGFENLKNGTCPLYTHFGHDFLKGGYLCYDNTLDGSECSSSKLVSLYSKSGTSKLVYSYSGDLDFTVDSSYLKYCNKNKESEKYCVYYDSKIKSENFFVFKLNTLDGYASGYNKVFRNGETGIIKFINDDNNGKCPSQIYEYNTFNKKIFISHESDEYGKLVSKYILDNCFKNGGNSTKVDISCDGLISKSLRNIINDVLSYIRIGVPLLLIILLGVDFAKATFSGDEKAISKSKNNAIKRIIIAIVIFFVPTLLNLLFDVANNVWKDSNYKICLFENESN